MTTRGTVDQVARAMAAAKPLESLDPVCVEHHDVLAAEVEWLRFELASLRRVHDAPTPESPYDAAISAVLNLREAYVRAWVGEGILPSEAVLCEREGRFWCERKQPEDRTTRQMLADAKRAGELNG